MSEIKLNKILGFSGILNGNKVTYGCRSFNVEDYEKYDLQAPLFIIVSGLICARAVIQMVVSRIVVRIILFMFINTGVKK